MFRWNKMHALGLCGGFVQALIFLETIVGYDIKVGRCSQLNE